MWEKENSEDLFEWFKSLSEREFNMAMTLYQMLSQEVTEEYVENNTNLAKEMLEAKEKWEKTNRWDDDGLSPASSSVADAV